MRTNKQVVKDANKLARRFASASGWDTTKKGMKFYRSENPRAKHFWNLAVVAYEVITGTEVEDALADIEGGGEI